MNWAFNVFPLLHPVLNRVYPKIAGKDQPLKKIWVNNVVHDAEHMCWTLSIKILSSVCWEPEDVDATIYCDVLLTGIGFWYPHCVTAFYAPVPLKNAHNIIFYFEALAVASACNDLKKTMEDYSKIIIYMDCMNTVNIFTSLRSQPEFNPLLHHCINIMIKKNFQI